MKNIPFFDYPQLWLNDREDLIKIIDEVSSTGGFIMQEDLVSFESELAQYLRSGQAIGVANATDAMEIFLQAIGINKGDEIIISSHTMLATASAIIANGGIPVPVDIGEDNLIDPDAISDAINKNTIGVMPTQLNGRTCKMDEIISICNNNSLFLTEDAAQALGSKYKGKFAGTFGLSSCISFFPAKVLGCLGDAGAVIVNDESLYDKIYQLHDHGRNIEGDVKSWGRNSRLDNLQAAILRYKLRDYDQVINRRREIAQIYHNQLNELNELKLPPHPNQDNEHYDVYQNYEIQAENRNALQQYLNEQNIGTLIQWGGTAVHQFRDLGFDQVLPNTEAFFEECIMLPMNIFLSDDDIYYVSNVLKNFYRG